MVKLEKVIKSNNPKYKYTAFFNLADGKQKKINFGAAGMSDYTIHKDKERRERYRARHKKDLRTNDPTRAGYLSLGILWSKPTLKESISFYKNLLNKYNKEKNIENFKKELLNTI